MRITFHGAARTVTGSKHLITLNKGSQILLDCGMFQGLGYETEALNENFGFDPKQISALILSHAHIDHSGLIPKLVKEGFTGKIFCTEATKDLAEILLYDSAEIQTYETDYINKRRAANNLAEYQPLYTPEDVADTMKLFETRAYNEWFVVDDDVAVVFTNTGHLIGSAAITLKINEDENETTIAFSGDVGRYRSVLLQPPAPFPQADYIILESTYGDKRHDVRFNTIETLQKWIIKTCVEKEGQLIIPAFSVGRTQEVLYALNQLSIEKRLPDLHYFVDSPLSIKATAAIKKFTDQFNDRLQQVLDIDDDPFHFPGLKYIESVEESKQLTASEKACVIISASGTADAGRVKHHINACIENKNNAILLVGYCGSKSLGGRLLAGAEQIEIFNSSCNVLAEIGSVQGMSAHADTDDLQQFLSCQDVEKVKGVFLVHGEENVQQSFAARLEMKGFKNVVVPTQGEEIDLSANNLQMIKTEAA
ncbi:MAG: MBL fold metallo-hydrolase [Bacteroidota bacterium]